jgi:stage V sporulation protein B
MAIELKSWVIKPGLVGVVMLLISKYIYSFCGIFSTGYAWNTLMAVTVNVIIAIILMITMGVLKLEEVRKLLMPFIKAKPCKR